MAANPKLETVWDFARYHANIGAACRCGHRGTIDRTKLERYWFVQLWDVRLIYACQHMRCSKCGGRPYKLALSFDAGSVEWGPRTEAEWTRLGRMAARRGAE